MGRTVTLNEVENQSVSELMQEASQRQEPLIVMPENRKAVFIHQYQPMVEVVENSRKLEPLPQFSVGVPASGKDTLYDEQHSGTMC